MQTSWQHRQHLWEYNYPKNGGPIVKKVTEVTAMGYIWNGGTKAVADITIRETKSEDLPFIYNSWLKSYKTSILNKFLPDSFYYRFHHDIFEALLGRSSCFVACNPADEAQIYGYIVVEYSDREIFLHWVYVKEIKRNAGIARLLEQRAIDNVGKRVSFTFFTKYNDKLARERKYSYVPFYAR